VPHAAMELDLRRAASAGAVLLLHLGLLAAFLFADYGRTRLPKSALEIEISIPAPAQNPPPAWQAIRPKLIAPSAPAITLPPLLPPVPEAEKPSPAPGAISGVGRALFGCDPAKLDLLSPEARATCLRLAPGTQPQQSVLLGPPPDPNSPFTKETKERFREAKPIMRPCPQGSYNDIRGLPCFGFDQEAPLLQER
jgi:hypothetical protein